MNPPLWKKIGIPNAVGFSLVEVTLAIGVVSFAVLSILGGMSVGFTTIHDARKDMTHAQIIAQISSSVAQAPFDAIEGYASSSPFYFDQVGRQLDSSSAALYSATLTVDSNGASTFPGASGDLSTSAKTVLVTIATVRPGSTNAIATSRSTLIVPKS